MPTDNSLITVISPANPRGQIQDRRQVVSKIKILSCKKLYKVGRMGNQAFNKYCLMIQKCITICEKKSSQPTVHTTQATKTSLVGAHNKRSDQGARRNSKSFDSKKGEEGREEVCGGVYHAFIVHEIIQLQCSPLAPRARLVFILKGKKVLSRSKHHYKSQLCW